MGGTPPPPKVADVINERPLTFKVSLKLGQQQLRFLI